MIPPAPQDDSGDGMDIFMDAFKTHKYKNAFSESNWEEEFDKMPIFMKTSPGEIDPVEHPDMACLQALIDGGTPEEQATSLKDEGNAYFKEKDYRKAIASYTAGLKKNCGGDRDIDAVLLTNRAAAHFHLGNVRSALNDATSAKKVKPGHLKASVRGARCCVELRRFAEAVRWCDAGLEAHPADAELLEMRTAADKRKRAAERDARKAKVKEKKDQSQKEDLLTAIRKRGIELLQADNMPEDGDPMGTTAEPTPDGLGSREEATGARVFLDEHGALHWPVLFLYPEHRQSDVVSAFCESDRFSDHLAVMFGEELPPWDTDRKYRPQSLQMFLDDREKETLYRVDPETSLLAALQHERCFVKAGMPSFIVLVEGSSFCKHFLTGQTVKRL